ncbi:MAG TPA: hypothetical protein VKE74_09935, partial [Gemmataceae bacterium]|nr:hypothetical protein [Gemmataceae bacterium]
NKELTAAIEKFEKTTSEILTPEQRTRLPQLYLQSDAAANLSITLRQPETAAKLGLTPDQLQTITKVESDGLSAARLLDTQPLPRRKQDELAMKLRDQTDERIMAVLSDAQKGTWKEMTGAPAGFRKSPIDIPRGGFGGAGGLGGGIGGPGGGGFGGGIGGPGGGIRPPIDP